jgi:3-oxoacyl-[acyl-carrier-protein] synthase-1
MATTSYPQNIGISSCSIVTSLGRGRTAHVAALQEGRSGLSENHHLKLPFSCFLGEVAELDTLVFPKGQAAYDNRANRLALAALKSDGFEEAAKTCKNKYSAARCGIVLGTSTAGVEKLEHVYRTRDADAPMPENYSMRHHDSLQAVSAFLQSYLGFQGPSYSISTACSSSAKAIIDAYQLVETGLCDAVIAGGVDSLCLTSVNGFESLELMSRQPCRPNDISRNGLSIGEAAAFVLVERDSVGSVKVTGYGESSDGTNMSTPPEDGAGACAAIRQALDRAGLEPKDIDYVNLHGTATIVNDATEARAVTAAIGSDVPASSLKGAIGHTLGAAGASEAVLCIYAMEEGILPGNVGLENLDPKALPNITSHSRTGSIRHVLSNSFGFGGSNCALVFSK